tara:strand:+ start:18654 stop:18839 length:186 start_codon:yes stop_codon:yes gene_type:complete
MRKFVVKRIVKPFLKKNGIEMCKGCDDAIAVSSYSLCRECQEGFDADMIAAYNREMLEVSQ